LGLRKLKPSVSEEELKQMDETERFQIMRHLEAETGAQPEVVGRGRFKRYKMKWTPNMDYIEVQVWREWTLDDIGVFEFSGTPPTGVFLNELLSRRIKIRDARTWPARDYVF
jgi:hypothetical protein